MTTEPQIDPGQALQVLCAAVVQAVNDNLAMIAVVAGGLMALAVIWYISHGFVIGRFGFGGGRDSAVMFDKARGKW